MFILALHFTARDTLRVEEVSGALLMVAGAVFFLGGVTPMMRRAGQVFGGLGLVAAGVLLVLAVRYGVRP
jgi:hypothetical protein